MAELSAPRRNSTKGAKMADETTFTQAQLDEAVAKAVAASNTANATRVAGLTRIAAGYGLDASALAMAVASGVSIEDFALDQSDKAAAARATAEAKPPDAAAAALAALKTDEDAAASAAASVEAPVEKTPEQEADALAAAIAAA